MPSEDPQDTNDADKESITEKEIFKSPLPFPTNTTAMKRVSLIYLSRTPFPVLQKLIFRFPFHTLLIIERNFVTMALQAVRYWRTMQASLAGKRSISSSTPRMKLFSSTNAGHHQSKHSKAGEMAPIWVLWGMVLVALAFGVHTAKQHLVHSPMVSVTKKRRESIWEVDNPDHVVGNVEKFENKSILRKVAHIQDEKYSHSDPTLPNFYTRPRKAETLRSVGVDTSNK